MHKVKTIILYIIIIGIFTGLGSRMDNQNNPFHTEDGMEPLPLPLPNNGDNLLTNPIAHLLVGDDDIELLDFDYYLYPDRDQGAIVLHAELRSVSSTIPEDVSFQFNEITTSLHVREFSTAYLDYYDYNFYSKNISDSYLFVGSVGYPTTAGNYTYNLTATIAETTYLLTNGTIEILSTILDPPVYTSPFDFYDFSHKGYEIFHNTFSFWFMFNSPFLPEDMNDFAVVIVGNEFILQGSPISIHSSLRSFHYQHDFGLLDTANHSYYFQAQYKDHSYTSEIKYLQTTAKTSGEVKLRVRSYPTSNQDYELMIFVENWQNKPVDAITLLFNEKEITINPGKPDGNYDGDYNHYDFVDYRLRTGYDHPISLKERMHNNISVEVQEGGNSYLYEVLSNEYYQDFANPLEISIGDYTISNEDHIFSYEIDVKELISDIEYVSVRVFDDEYGDFHWGMKSTAPGIKEEIDDTTWKFTYQIDLSKPDFAYYKVSFAFYYRVTTAEYEVRNTEFVLDHVFLGDMMHPETSFTKDKQYSVEISTMTSTNWRDWEGFLHSLTIPSETRHLNIEFDRPFGNLDIVRMISESGGYSYEYNFPLITDAAGHLNYNLEEVFILMNMGLPLRDYFYNQLIATYGEDHSFSLSNSTLSYLWTHQAIKFSIAMEFNSDGFMTYMNFTEQVNQYQRSFVQILKFNKVSSNGLNIPTYPLGWLAGTGCLGMVYVLTVILFGNKKRYFT